MPLAVRHGRRENGTMGPQPTFSDTQRAWTVGKPNTTLGLSAWPATECGREDSFGARHHAPALGRFLTPVDGSDQHEADPQSWTLFFYVRRSPMTFTDPDGHRPRGKRSPTPRRATVPASQPWT